MKKLLLAVLILLLLVIILITGAGFYFYFKFKPFFTDTVPAATQSGGSESSPTTTAEVVDKNPLLNEQQEQTLEKLGVDPAKLPTQITPELEACFITKLGAPRVEAIKSGTAPTAIDFFKAQACLNK